jgi:glucokinase
MPADADDATFPTAARPYRSSGAQLVLAADGAAVLDAVNAKGTSTARELASAVGLSVARARTCTRRLAHRGLVGMRGREVHSLPTPAGHVLAVDVGGSKIRAALTDLHGQVLAETVVATEQADVAGQVAAVLKQLSARGAGGAQLLAACVGIPASYDSRADRAWNAGNLSELCRISPSAELARALGVDVTVTQDVRLAAVGERWRGHGRGRDDFAVMCVGTGVAMGLVLDGRVYEGTGAAGELAYLPIGNDPFSPDHRERGPYEDAVSGPALARRFARASGSERAADARDARMVFQAADAGDAVAAQALAEEEQLIALGISTISSVLDLRLVVLGGGLGSRASLLDSVRSHVHRLLPEPPRIESSPIAHRGPLLGAVAVALAALPASHRDQQETPTGTTMRSER